MASIIGLPSGAWRVHADTEGYEYDHTESAISVSLSAPNGTTGITQGAECPLVATVTLSSWEVWMDPNTFETESRNESSTPLDGTSVQFSVEWGDGWLSNGTSTDASGHASASYTMGSQAASIRAEVDFGGGMVGAGTLMFDAPAAESWSYDHQEGSYSVNISTDGDSAVASGGTRGVIIDVVYSSWDVEVSSTGEQRISNYQSSPAIGASVWWAIDMGDGVVYGEGSTDYGGFAVAEFTMGTSDAVVTAYVDYGGSNSASASQFFSFTTAEEVPMEESGSWSGPEYVVENLSFGASTENLAPGDLLAVTGTLMWYGWERWTDNYGNEQYTYSDPVPAGASSVSVGIMEGDAEPSTYSPATDVDGQFSFSVEMGSASSQICVDGPDNSGTGPIQWLTINNETWSVAGTETAYSLELITPAAGSAIELAAGEIRTLTAKVTAVDITLLASSAGNWDYQYGDPYEAAGAQVEFNLAGLDGYLSNPTAYSDGAGLASVDFTMGLEPASVTASIGSSSANVAFNPAPLPEWELVNEEGVVDVSITADAPMTGLATGDVRVLTAHVSYDTWRTERSRITGAEKTSNTGSAPAIGAPISFMVEQGDGTLGTQSTSTTNNNGDVTITFTMGAGESCQVMAAASYAGADSFGYADFSLLQWTKQSQGGSRLDVDLSTSATGCGVTAQVNLATWEIWTRGAETEQRALQISPATYAEVTFSVLPSSGIVTPPTAVTGIQGIQGIQGTASTTYTVQEPSTVKADVTFAGLTGSASITVNPEGTGWIDTGTTGGELQLTLTDDTAADPDVVRAEVMQTTWDVWTRGAETMRRNEVTVPAAGAGLTFSALTGAATFQPATAVTSNTGAAASVYTATQNSTINCVVTLGALSSATTLNVLANSSGSPGGPGGPGSSDSPFVAKFSEWKGGAIASFGGGMEDDPEAPIVNKGITQEKHYMLGSEYVPPIVVEGDETEPVDLDGLTPDQWIAAHSTLPPPVVAKWYRFEESYDPNTGDFLGKRLHVKQPIDPLGPEEILDETSTTSADEFNGWQQNITQYPTTPIYEVSESPWTEARVIAVGERLQKYVDAKHTYT